MKMSYMTLVTLKIVLHMKMTLINPFTVDMHKTLCWAVHHVSSEGGSACLPAILAHLLWQQEGVWNILEWSSTIFIVLECNFLILPDVIEI